MGTLKEFVISFAGLSEGIHKYDYKVSRSFFEEAESTEIEDGDVEVKLELEKQTRMLIFNFQISGTIVVPCDRCLDPMNVEIESENRLIVKFGERWDEEDDEVLIIPEHEHKIDIKQFIAEFIELQIPMRKVHPEDENGESSCNPEILKKLKEHQAAEIDPRWEALKNLKIN